MSWRCGDVSCGRTNQAGEGGEGPLRISPRRRVTHNRGIACELGEGLLRSAREPRRVRGDSGSSFRRAQNSGKGATTLGAIDHRLGQHHQVFRGPRQLEGASRACWLEPQQGEAKIWCLFGCRGHERPECSVKTELCLEYGGPPLLRSNGGFHELTVARTVEGVVLAHIVSRFPILVARILFRCLRCLVGIAAGTHHETEHPGDTAAGERLWSRA